MPKNRNMGRKSHHVQDAQFNQHADSLQGQVGEQPTRPTVSPMQATKSSKEEPRSTK